MLKTPCNGCKALGEFDPANPKCKSCGRCFVCGDTGALVAIELKTGQARPLACFFCNGPPGPVPPAYGGPSPN